MNQKPFFYPRILALLLSLSLAAPNPALALRPNEMSQQQAGLEDLKKALGGEPTAAGLEERKMLNVNGTTQGELKRYLDSRRPWLNLAGIVVNHDTLASAILKESKRPGWGSFPDEEHFALRMYEEASELKLTQDQWSSIAEILYFGVTRRTVLGLSALVAAIIAGSASYVVLRTTSRVRDAERKAWFFENLIKLYSGNDEWEPDPQARQKIVEELVQSDLIKRDIKKRDQLWNFLKTMLESLAGKEHDVRVRRAVVHGLLQLSETDKHLQGDALDLFMTRLQFHNESPEVRKEMEEGVKTLRNRLQGLPEAGLEEAEFKVPSREELVAIVRPTDKQLDAVKERLRKELAAINAYYKFQSEIKVRKPVGVDQRQPTEKAYWDAVKRLSWEDVAFIIFLTNQSQPLDDQAPGIKFAKQWALSRMTNWVEIKKPHVGLAGAAVVKFLLGEDPDAQSGDVRKALDGISRFDKYAGLRELRKAAEGVIRDIRQIIRDEIRDATPEVGGEKEVRTLESGQPEGGLFGAAGDEFLKWFRTNLRITLPVSGKNVSEVQISEDGLPIPVAGVAALQLKGGLIIKIPGAQPIALQWDGSDGFDIVSSNQSGEKRRESLKDKKDKGKKKLKFSGKVVMEITQEGNAIRLLPAGPVFLDYDQMEWLEKGLRLTSDRRGLRDRVVDQLIASGSASREALVAQVGALLFKHYISRQIDDLSDNPALSKLDTLILEYVVKEIQKPLSLKSAEFLTFLYAVREGLQSRGTGPAAGLEEPVDVSAWDITQTTPEPTGVKFPTGNRTLAIPLAVLDQYLATHPNGFSFDDGFGSRLILSKKGAAFQISHPDGFSEQPLNLVPGIPVGIGYRFEEKEGTPYPRSNFLGLANPIVSPVVILPSVSMQAKINGDALLLTPVRSLVRTDQNPYPASMGLRDVLLLRSVALEPKMIGSPFVQRVHSDRKNIDAFLDDLRLDYLMRDGVPVYSFSSVDAADGTRKINVTPGQLELLFNAYKVDWTSTGKQFLGQDDYDGILRTLEHFYGKDVADRAKSTGLEEKEKARVVLRDFLSKQDVVEAIKTLSDTGVDSKGLAGYFDELQQKFKDAGYKGELLTPSLSELPAAPETFGKSVYVDQEVPGRDALVANLKEAGIPVLEKPEQAKEANIIIGIESTKVTAKQALLQVDENTARPEEIPALLKYLEDRNLLNPGAVVVLHLRFKRSDDVVDSFLLFA